MGTIDGLFDTPERRRKLEKPRETFETRFEISQSFDQLENAFDLPSIPNTCLGSLILQIA
jgi:hypothetical protein